MADRPVNPPPEAIAYLEGKSYQPAFDWRDVWGEEHAYAFTVAKATEMDVLTGIRKSVDRAMRDGVPFEQFRAELEPTLKKLGWWGRQERSDPVTGEISEVQLGSPRRLQTIYWANTRTANAAGQWERAQRTKQALPYFVYELGPSEVHRPHHVDWANRPTVLPVDDPWWDTHYPPNGWGCKCRLRPITRFEAERIDAPAGAPETEFQDYVNKRTGETTQIPVGIDPGWHTNPGKSRARTLMQQMHYRLEEAGEQTARKTIADFWDSQTPEALMKVPERLNLPAAISKRAISDMGGNAAGIRTISVTQQTLAAKIGKHAEVTLASFVMVQELLDDGERVRRPDGSIQYWKRIDGKWWVVALRKSATGFVRVGTLFRARTDQLESVKRIEREIFGE